MQILLWGSSLPNHGLTWAEVNKLPSTWVTSMKKESRARKKSIKNPSVMKKFYCSCVWFQCVLCFLWKLFLCFLCWHQTWNDFFRCCSPVAGDGLNLTMLCLVNFSEPISQNLKFHNMLNRPWSQVKVKSAWSVCRSFFPCCKPIRKKTWCWFSFLLRLQVC